MLEELARYSSVPVINMLTARHHPCQALADLLTLREALRPRSRGCGSPTSATATTSRARWRILGSLAGLDVAVASPPGYQLEADLGARPGRPGRCTLHTDPREAVAGAHAVYTDVWVSMGDEEHGGGQRRATSRPTASTIGCSTPPAPDAFAMHDLPAHPGEEITAEVLYGERQRIWDQAENRRHAQKALLELLVGAPGTP